MLIINAKLFPMDAPPIENGFLLTNGGVIEAVGPMTQAPVPVGETVDAQGGWLFPGFIDAHTHLGMWEDGLGFEGDDGNEDTDPSTPHLRAIDAINPMDRCFREALKAGVTTVVTGPGSANAIGGQMAAVKTAGVRMDDMIVKAPVAIKMALGENPKTVYHGKNESPVTRMATAAIIREQLKKAQRYLEDCEAAERDGETDPPEFDAKCEALLPLLKREIPAHFHAHRCDDIFTAMRIAKEFRLRYTIVHGTQGWRAADILAQEGAEVFAGPLLCDRSKPELRDLTPASPGLLTQAGVTVAIITDHPVIPIQYLPLCAGLAVREGMAWEDAIRAITIVPAQLCGIDSRVGTLTPGSDADFVLFDGDPLQLSAKPQMVVV
ncbi:MAG: amidohydrolase, partial [Clostridiales bacterium]|nr:amidohydrolase [Clostridiales bacterium]